MESFLCIWPRNHISIPPVYPYVSAYGVLSRQLFLKSGQGNPYQSITTFPELPLFIASKPSR